MAIKIEQYRTPAQEPKLKPEVVEAAATVKEPKKPAPQGSKQS
jgi:hypothetical protein